MALETKRKLIKFSNYSFCITLPKEAIDQMGWKKGDTVAVMFDDQSGKIIVSKNKGNKSNNRSSNGNSKKSAPAAKIEEDIQPIPKLRW